MVGTPSIPDEKADPNGLRAISSANHPRAPASIDKLPQQSEGLLQALIQAIPDLIWLKDTSGTY